MEPRPTWSWAQPLACCTSFAHAREEALVTSFTTHPTPWATPKGVHVTSVSTRVDTSAQPGAQIVTKTLQAGSCGMKGTTAQPSVSLCCCCRRRGSRSTLFPAVCIPWETVKHPAVTSQDRRAAAHLESFTDVPIIVHHFILPRLSFGALQNTRSLARGSDCPSLGVLRAVAHSEKGDSEGSIS